MRLTPGMSTAPRPTGAPARAGQEDRDLTALVVAGHRPGHTHRYRFDNLFARGTWAVPGVAGRNHAWRSSSARHSLRRFASTSPDAARARHRPDTWWSWVRLDAPRSWSSSWHWPTRDSARTPSSCSWTASPRTSLRRRLARRVTRMAAVWSSAEVGRPAPPTLIWSVCRMRAPVIVLADEDASGDSNAVTAVLSAAALQGGSTGRSRSTPRQSCSRRGHHGVARRPAEKCVRSTGRRSRGRVVWRLRVPLQRPTCRTPGRRRRTADPTRPLR